LMDNKEACSVNNNNGTEKQKIGKVSKNVLPLLLDDNVVDIGGGGGDRNEDVVELEEDIAVVSSSMSSPPRATSGQQQQQQQQTTPEAFMMAASPPPYQDVGTHLRPVTFGDLERLKRELMDGFRQMLSNELTKFLETRSSTH
uniref:VASP_tetra domain-containing protein n=1 Tax=Globodera pallida TaxID=36090 RepID=A0A183CR49_GLOPA